jgi:thiamine pyrophosphate-dependent acetolactate synthase large subunit-like protein
MEQQTLEARVVELERRLKELSTSVSINMEWLAEIREMLQQLLAVLERRTKQELAWDKPKSLISETSNASKPKYEAMLERLWPMIKRDYETQGA